MARYDSCEQTYLARIDDYDWPPCVPLGRALVPYGLCGVDEYALHVSELFSRDAAPRERVNYAQADGDTLSVPLRLNARPRLQMLFEASAKLLRLTDVPKSLGVSKTHLVDSVETLLSGFWPTQSGLGGVVPFPLNLEAVHCGESIDGRCRGVNCNQVDS